VEADRLPVEMPLRCRELVAEGEDLCVLLTVGARQLLQQHYDMLSASFGPGFNGPLTITVEATDAKTAGTTSRGGGSRWTLKWLIS
jgi:hypothetical protein